LGNIRAGPSSPYLARPEILSSRRNLKLLEGYCIPMRYPNGLPGETPSEYSDDVNEVNRALELSRKIVDLSEKKINTSFLDH
jgi:HEPN domain-containing protein